MHDDSSDSDDEQGRDQAHHHASGMTPGPWHSRKPQANGLQHRTHALKPGSRADSIGVEVVVHQATDGLGQQPTLQHAEVLYKSPFELVQGTQARMPHTVVGP